MCEIRGNEKKESQMKNNWYYFYLDDVRNDEYRGNKGYKITL